MGGIVTYVLELKRPRPPEPALAHVQRAVVAVAAAAP